MNRLNLALSSIFMHLRCLAIQFAWLAVDPADGLLLAHDCVVGLLGESLSL